MELQNPLKRLRESYNLSIKEVSQEVCIPIEMIKRYESPSLNYSSLKVNTIRKLAKFYNLSADELIHLLDNYKKDVDKYNIQSFNDTEPTPIPYTCELIIFNYCPRVIGARVRNLDTGEVSILTRSELISLVRTKTISFDNLTVGSNDSIRVRHNVEGVQTGKYDDNIPDYLKVIDDL